MHFQPRIFHNLHTHVHYKICMGKIGIQYWITLLLVFTLDVTKCVIFTRGLRFNRLIIADELDYLITKDRAVLHDLFMLTTFPFSRCILIGTVPSKYIIKIYCLI